MLRAPRTGVRSNGGERIKEFAAFGLCSGIFGCEEVTQARNWAQECGDGERSQERWIKLQRRCGAVIGAFGMAIALL